ncbi:MAG TPA: prepilin-type N-terminal cleavage/methylation domain-containing protein, partial [Desulfitobacteriaceae bacterium]|nr:prepilin-type N-terminal cleavage/methylation domain-containing protein [Desulfitobacteriaceae bacterium]
MKIKKLIRKSGFTLLEVMMVIVILAILTAIATPKFLSSAELARRNADIATGHQLKTALDRYHAENGYYPKKSEVMAAAGAVSAVNLIPKYISRLDKNVTQQKTSESQLGFGVADLPANGDYSALTASNIIMIYLNS